MSRRKTALELGYKSLFDYCVNRLKLSEGSVARRIQVANMARRFPQMLVALAENTITLTAAGLLAPHLRTNNADKLIADGAGLSSRAVEECLVALQPRASFDRRSASSQGRPRTLRKRRLRHHQVYRPLRGRRPLPSCNPRAPRRSTSASPPTRNSKKSSSGWRR